MISRDGGRGGDGWVGEGAQRSKEIHTAIMFVRELLHWYPLQKLYITCSQTLLYKYIHLQIIYYISNIRMHNTEEFQHG